MMNDAEMAKELDELMIRFKRLKKSLDEREAAPKALPKLNREQILAKAKEIAEQQHSQRLANQLQKAGILGTRPPPRQPSNEEMQMAAQNMWAQSNGFSSQDAMEKAEAGWGNNLNNWLIEATKPINSRFKSEAEELAYWSKVKVNDGSGGNEGY